MFVGKNVVKSDLNRARAKFSPPPTLREGVLDRFHLLFYPIDISINSLTFTQEILRYDWLRYRLSISLWIMNDARSLALCGLKNKTKQNEPDLFWATSRFTTKYLNCSLSISKRDSLSGPHPHQFSGDRTSDIKSDCWSRVRLRVVKLWISRPRSPLNLQNHERILYYKTNREALG